MAWIPIIATFILGAILGSFINVLIYRMPREESLWHPRSHCPHCKAMIPWFRNIPIISFLFKMENAQSVMHLFPGNIPLLKLSMDAFGLCVFIFLYPYKRG